MKPQNTKKIKNRYKVSVAILLLTVSLFLYLKPIDRQEIPANFFLSESPGMGHIEGELLLGAIPINQTGSRTIIVSNEYNRKILVKIKSMGEIKKNIIVSENNFYLDPKEQKSLTFTAFTNGLTEYKEYSGKIIIISKRA